MNPIIFFLQTRLAFFDKRLFLLLVIKFCVSISIYGQEEIFDHKSSITFEFRSLEMKEKELEFLNELKFSLINSLEVIENYKIKLVTFYCQSEIVSDPFIGLMRVKKVLDYFCSDGKLEYNYFLIEDSGPSSVGFNAHSDCDFPAVYISLYKCQ